MYTLLAACNVRTRKSPEAMQGTNLIMIKHEYNTSKGNC